MVAADDAAADLFAPGTFAWLPDLTGPAAAGVQSIQASLEGVAATVQSTQTSLEGVGALLRDAIPTMPADVLANPPDILQAGTAIISDLTPEAVGFQLAALALVGLGSAIARAEADGEAPYPPGTNTYSPALADAFYSKRPLMLANRLLTLGRLTSAFTAGVLWDWLVLGKLLKDEEYTALRRAEPERAKKALILCEQLGPTFIKLGQALSIRTDLIPEAYALELRQLQDAVPPFPSQEAKDVLRRQLGVRDLNQIFATLSAVPVASASIGQVYKGTLKDANSTAVAVKVQRPGILAQISLDLYVLRLITPIQTYFSNVVNGIKTDAADIDAALQLVDEWGRGFVAETDYRLEAKNTVEFEKSMQSRGLDAICAPTVVEDLVRDTVLVTEWVEGTRLDRDASPDVPRLCGVAINAYLTMLLDTGTLHCDPHPGNLLRTTDGKLCILDWGMTLSVPPALQYGLLEFIAHLNTDDYDAIPQDFVNLGFSPEGVSAERLKASGITDGLSFAFRQLSAGGGPKKIGERVQLEFRERYGTELTDRELEQAARSEMIQRMEDQLAAEGVDVKGVTNVMEEMSRRNRELFAVPPYVLYVARAFSTLEGIGLTIDEDYAIVQECYPYLARRLFTDRSPRAEAALRSMLGLSPSSSSPALTTAGMKGVVVPTNGMGGGGQAGGLSPTKLIEMSDNFATSVGATANVDQDGAGQAEAVREFASLILDPEGSTLQDILVDETSRIGDAALRQALRTALIDTPSSLVGRFGLKPPQALEQLLLASDEDQRALQTAQELADLVGPRVRERLDSTEGSPQAPQVVDAVSSLFSPLVTDPAARDTAARQLEGLSLLSRRISARLLRRSAERAPAVRDLPGVSILPAQARDALVSAPSALADALDPVERR